MIGLLTGGFRIGRLLGFRVRIDYSWFIVLALITWTFATWQFPQELPGLPIAIYFAMGLAGALLLFLSVLLHELAHSVVARSRGIPVTGITLFIFGGVAEMQREPERPLDEFLLTIVGPLSSLALAGVFFALARAFPLLGWPAPTVVAGTLATLNTVLAVFNMVPAFPLDGGRVLRSLLWRLTGDASLATRWATWIGRGFGWLLIAYGFLLFMQGMTLAGMWGILLGWFLTSAATTAARQAAVRRAIRDVQMEQLIGFTPAGVHADLSVEELVEDYVLRLPVTAFPVTEYGRVIGVVTVPDIQSMSLDDRAATPVREVMRPIDRVLVVPHDRPVMDVVVALRGGDHDRVVITREGRIGGAMSADELIARIQRIRGIKRG